MSRSRRQDCVDRSLQPEFLKGVVWLACRVEGAKQGYRKAVECDLQPSKVEVTKDFGVCLGSLAGRTSIDLSLDFATMMIKDSSLREDPDLRGELEFLARGCDFVLPSRFKKRLKSFQRAQVSPVIK